MLLCLQISFFGMFINIKLETEIIIKLLTELKDKGFLPGTTDLCSLDLNTGKINVDSRLILVSPDKTWRVAFFPNRIDFNYNYQPGTAMYNHIGDVLECGKELINNVFSVFTSTTGNRLALNCKVLLENMEDDQLAQFSKRFTTPLESYNVDSYTDWHVQYNAHGNFKVSETEKEECNRITEISTAVALDTMPSIGESFLNNGKGIVLSVDVNTLQSNDGQRFKYNNLVCFVDDASGFVSEILNEILNEIESDYK